MDSLERDYFYDQSQCHVSDLGALTLGSRMRTWRVQPLAAAHARGLGCCGLLSLRICRPARKVEGLLLLLIGILFMQRQNDWQ